MKQKRFATIFTPTGGKVSLELVPNPKGKLQFVVSNNGIGMSPEMTKALFRMDGKNNRIGTDGGTQLRARIVVMQGIYRTA